MKKIISCLALTVLLFACSKKELPLPSDQELTSETSLDNKGGNSSPTVTTTYYSPDITYTSATAGGTVSSSGGGNTVTERGICYNTSPNPTIENFKVPSGSGSGSFNCSITGLTPSTFYYIRAYATKSAGTTYGNQLTFTTLTTPVYGTVTDYDGNEYTTIKIGTQTWMMENLKTTHYSNGDPIPNVTDNLSWLNLMSATEKGAYCNYNNDEGMVATYGRLYNWYAASDPRNLAPVGWHVPLKTDWDKLESYLGAIAISSNIVGIGRKLKETGTTHWTSPNPADNISGFTALGGGWRWGSGGFSYFNTLGRFWSSSMAGGWAYFRQLAYNSEDITWMIVAPNPDYYRVLGLSVRCVKD
jgi:uncharacterized protein (TIGR02145 family)